MKNNSDTVMKSTDNLGEREETRLFVLQISSSRYIPLLLLLCCAHITFVAADGQDRSECTPSRFDVILNCSERNLLEIPDIGPEIDRRSVVLLLLEGNNISKIEARSLSGFDNLEELYLGGNDIRYLENGTFREVPRLKLLDIQNSKLFAIESGAFGGLEILEEIFLGFNTINFLPDGIFAGMFRLEVIQVRSNPLRDRSISENTFRNLTSLRFIDMSETWLTTLPIDLFQDCTNLQNVIFHNTLLISVNMIHWPIAPYKIVDFRYSPIVNITNVPKEVTILKASLRALQCTCENERAILLVLAGQNISSHCQNLRCNIPTDENVVTAVAPHHMSPEPDSTYSTSDSVYSRNHMQLYFLLVIAFTSVFAVGL